MLTLALGLTGILLLAWFLSPDGRTRVERLGALRALWLAPVALLLQVPLLRGWWTREIAAGLLMTSYVLLLVFVWLNRTSRPILLMGIGLALNLLVIVANGGFMPVSPETLSRIVPEVPTDEWRIGVIHRGSKDIVLLRNQTRLWFLSDVLVLPPPWPWPSAFSIGDVLVFAGFVWLCWQAFLKPTPTSSHRMKGEASHVSS